MKLNKTDVAGKICKEQIQKSINFDLYYFDFERYYDWEVFFENVGFEITFASIKHGATLKSL